ncbi:hypothetical protein BGZ75_001314 [Mortierella antarctica]|nr:hypothetical protein BGZ75_001314 [Mortierella antarctica]
MANLTAETLAALRCHFKNGYTDMGLSNDRLLELDDAMGKLDVEDNEDEESSDSDHTKESSHEVSPILRTYHLQAG